MHSARRASSNGVSGYLHTGEARFQSVLQEDTCPMCREMSSAEDSYVMITDNELAMQHADYVKTLTDMLNCIDPPTQQSTR